METPSLGLFKKHRDVIPRDISLHGGGGLMIELDGLFQTSWFYVKQSFSPTYTQRVPAMRCCSPLMPQEPVQR